MSFYKPLFFFAKINTKLPICQSYLLKFYFTTLLYYFLIRTVYNFKYYLSISTDPLYHSLDHHLI